MACSRATSAKGLYIIRHTDFQGPSPPKENENISLELIRLESNKLETTFNHLHNIDRQCTQLYSPRTEFTSSYKLNIKCQAISLLRYCTFKRNLDNFRTDTQHAEFSRNGSR